MAATSGGRHFGGSKNLFAGRKYCRENTLFVNVKDNSFVKPEEVITFIHETCGVGSLLACVPKCGNLYEITLDGKAPIQYLLEGIKIGDNTFECNEVVPSSLVVSFMHLPAYVDDNEIEATLKSMGVELLSPINRRFYPGTTIADGTRYAKVRLPEHMTSFPYTLKFQKDYYRCIHNGQLKVCSLCYSSEHLFRACPEFRCFKCKEQGHYARACKSTRCKQCEEWEHRCSCRVSEHGDEGEIDEWDHEVNNEDDMDVHSVGDEEAPEGDQETGDQEIGDQEKSDTKEQDIEGKDTEETETSEQNGKSDNDKTKETQSEKIPPDVIDSEIRESEKESSTVESDLDTEVTVKNTKKRKGKEKNKGKAKKNK